MASVKSEQNESIFSTTTRMPIKANLDGHHSDRLEAVIVDVTKIELRGGISNHSRIYIIF